MSLVHGYFHTRHSLFRQDLNSNFEVNERDNEEGILQYCHAKLLKSGLNSGNLFRATVQIWCGNIRMDESRITGGWQAYTQKNHPRECTQDPMWTDCIWKEAMYLHFKFCKNPPSGFGDSQDFSQKIKENYQINNFEYRENKNILEILFLHMLHMLNFKKASFNSNQHTRPKHQRRLRLTPIQYLPWGKNEHDVKKQEQLSSVK